MGLLQVMDELPHVTKCTGRFLQNLLPGTTHRLQSALYRDCQEGRGHPQPWALSHCLEEGCLLGGGVLSQGRREPVTNACG